MINNQKSLTDIEVIDKTANYVKSELKEAEGGHDWFHIERVWKNAVYIARKENKGDLLIIELAALLHDIADAKFHNGDESIGPRLAGEFLRSLELPEETVNHVIKIVENISFRKRHLNSTFNSIELQIVQDADRLDAIGAIGIARVFNFGGYMNRRLYDPIEFEGTQAINGNQNNRHTIGHFYDKLLLLSKMMNTETGRILAKERHDFMEAFLKQFYKEWEGLT
jgi:uncharacterized protein